MLRQFHKLTRMLSKQGRTRNLRLQELQEPFMTLLRGRGMALPDVKKMVYAQRLQFSSLFGMPFFLLSGYQFSSKEGLWALSTCDFPCSLRTLLTNSLCTCVHRDTAVGLKNYPWSQSCYIATPGIEYSLSRKQVTTKKEPHSRLWV